MGLGFCEFTSGYNDISNLCGNEQLALPQFTIGSEHDSTVSVPAALMWL